MSSRLHEFVDQRRGGDEAHREALLAGGEAEAEGNVGLAGAAVAERDDVLLALDVLAALEAETRAMEAIEKLVGPVMKAHPDMRVSEALETLAREGNAQVAALLAHFNRPGVRLHDLLLAKAVEADPYWSKSEDGSTYHVRASATHQTPEEFVAAYIEGSDFRLLEDVGAELLDELDHQELRRQAEEALERCVGVGEL